MEDVKPKYYYYVSNNKVDMLYSQIQESLLKRLLKGLTFELKIVKKQFSEPTSSLIEKLQVVVACISEKCEVGTIDEPKEYFYDVLHLRWCYPVPGLVYFGGNTKHTVLGLGGSEKHVQGHTPKIAEASFSIPADLVAALKEISAASDFGTLNSAETGNRNEYLNLVETVSTEINGPGIHVEFLAKLLIKGSGLNKRVVLGTPIYVASAD